MAQKSGTYGHVRPSNSISTSGKKFINKPSTVGSPEFLWFLTILNGHSSPITDWTDSCLVEGIDAEQSLELCSCETYPLGKPLLEKAFPVITI